MTSLPPHRPFAPVPPPPPRPVLGTGARVAIAGAVVAVLGLCSIPVIGFIGWMYFGPDIDDAKAVATQYLSRLEAGDDAAAYQLVCASTRRETSNEEFTALVEAGPRPSGHTIGYGAFLDEPGHSAFVRAELTAPPASPSRSQAAAPTRAISLTVVDDDGPWLICGDKLI